MAHLDKVDMIVSGRRQATKIVILVKDNASTLIYLYIKLQNAVKTKLKF